MGYDAVEPDPCEVSLVAQQSYEIWSGYLEDTRTHTGIAEACIRIQNIIGSTPAFPLGWLKYLNKSNVRHFRDGSSKLYLSGHGHWHDTRSSCRLCPKVMETSLLVGVQMPRWFKLVDDGRFREWPGIINFSDPVEGNYLALLVFAWAYILSARWVESSIDSIVDHGEVEYLNHDSKGSHSSVVDIDIGQASCEALCWWRAITSPGQGWRSTVRFNGIQYQSPWSISVSDDPRIEIQASCASSAILQHRPPSSKEALGFLTSFCEVHGLHDQFYAALSVAMFIPTTEGCENQLPTPKNYPKNYPRKQPWMPNSSLQEEEARIPYYMTVACNTRGIVALLSAAFFDPTIPCNLVSPFLDPIFKILDPLLAQNDYKTFLSLLQASPASPLWLGALMIGFEKFPIRTARTGTQIIDLVAGAWSGIDLSFITTQIKSERTNAVSRADECRLLFFMSCLGYERPPICPWQPFGTIPLNEAEIEVQMHSSCRHEFKYRGWRWDSSLSSDTLDVGYRHVPTLDAAVAIKPEITHPMAIKISSDIASKTATRSIFTWLRGDGWPLAEKHVRQHEWVFESEDDSDCSSQGSTRSLNSSCAQDIQQWLSSNGRSNAAC